MNKTYKNLLGVLMVLALFLVGCGGNSSNNDKTIMESERPDAAAIRIANQIRASQASSRSASDTRPILDLYDLAGNQYSLMVASVTRTDLDAVVSCIFYYGNGSNQDAMTIDFALKYDEGKWWFDDVSITDGGEPGPGPDPVVIENGVEGYIRDQNNAAIEGALVQAYSVNYLETVAGYDVTNSEGKYQIELKPGDYLLVATKDGYTIGTISVTVNETNSEIIK